MLMRTKVILLLSFIFFTIAAAAQDYQMHTVLKGETIKSIARKHSVTPFDIYRLNPDAKKGITENMVLLIPAQIISVQTPPVKEKPTKVVNTIHILQESETYYSLSKKYSVSVAEIEKANPKTDKNDLQIGEEIIIPIIGSGVVAQVEKAEKVDEKKDIEAFIYHTVQAGETKYSIARNFDISLQLLEELNPEVKDILPLGYKLKLVNKKVVTNQMVVNSHVDSTYMIYVVRPKETFYNLNQKTGLTKAQIIALNPEAKDGLKEGMHLKLPKATTVKEDSIYTVRHDFIDLTATLVKDNPKKLALLLPFNISRIKSDSIRMQLVRNDRFLNLTLDFYAGALMAIDSADVMGLPLTVKIYDANESKNTSDIAKLRSKLYDVDAVIGPFFPSNAESAAALLNTIPVISPLAKDNDNTEYKNLYLSVPSSENTKQAILNYLVSQEGQKMAIIDSKKASSRKYLAQNYPSVAVIPLNTNGSIDKAMLKKWLSKNSNNFVLLETERSGLAINTIKELADMLDEYKIQLVVVENSDLFENPEIPVSKLTALKMTYPSVGNDSDTERKKNFVYNFTNKMGYAPNQYAVRGFDVTLDAILRIFQEESFAATDSIATEQIENKFMYKTIQGAHNNTGVYIMQYDEELSIKQLDFVRKQPEVTEDDLILIED